MNEPVFRQIEHLMHSTMSKCDGAPLVWRDTPLADAELLSIAYKLMVWDEVHESVHKYIRGEI